MNAYRLLSFIISIDICRLLIHFLQCSGGVAREYCGSTSRDWHVAGINIIILNTNTVYGFTCVPFMT